ncbi:MAG: D-alanine--D-alanine ligase [Candidatus Adlerbacteria bacterium]|nr:D-alanine--D-alanine ligase [Candidatus Adlerbacteria bacterium]
MREVVGVLRGGPSSEYEVSLKSGASVLAALNEGQYKDKYDVRDIFIDREGVWHAGGIPANPDRALQGIDVVFNALHGEYGEDGNVQRLLQTLGVPYTGSGPESAALTFNKHLTNTQAKKLGVKVAHNILVNADDDLDARAFELFRSFPHPAIVKPVRGGSSVGTTVADSYHALRTGLDRAAAVSPVILVEEFIKGREATVGVLDHFRNEDTYALMPVEIIPAPHRSFFDYDAKYSGETTERVPGNFTDEQKRELARVAKLVHSEMGLDHYSRSDFIVSPRGIYFLEVNTLPGLTQESLLPKALHAVGMKFADFLEHVLTLARTRTRK